MNETPHTPDHVTPPSTPRPRELEYDEHGNVTGVVFTQEVDFHVEFVDTVPPRRPAPPSTDA